jgi:membrane protease YdiL (CAAX protease family)
MGSSSRSGRPELFALAAAMIFPTAMAWFYFRALAGGGGAVNPLQQLVYSGGKLLQFAFPLLWCRYYDRAWPSLRRPPRGFAAFPSAAHSGPLRGFAAFPSAAHSGRERRDGLLWGLGFGLLTAAFMFGLFHGWLAGGELFAGTADRVRDKMTEFGVASPGRYFALAAFIVALHSLLEEYYWRWFVFGRLQRHIALTPAIVLSSLAFMSHHVLVLDAFFPGHFLTGVVPFSLGVAVGGAFWAWLYHRTDSLAACWLSHLLVDAAIFILGWQLIGGTS